MFSSPHRARLDSANFEIDDCCVRRGNANLHAITQNLLNLPAELLSKPADLGVEFMREAIPREHTSGCCNVGGYFEHWPVTERSWSSV